LLAAAKSSDNKYSTFENVGTTSTHIKPSPTPTIQDKPAPPTLKDALTPTVVSICITYGFFALQAVFMDGKT
jgi:hypothetical protein